MDNELLNNVQSPASRLIFTCSESTKVQKNNRSRYEIFSKLTIKASERRQYCYLGTDSNVLPSHCGIGTSKWQYNLVRPLGWTQYPLKQVLNTHIYPPNKRRNK